MSHIILWGDPGNYTWHQIIITAILLTKITHNDFLERSYAWMGGVISVMTVLMVKPSCIYALCSHLSIILPSDYSVLSVSTMPIKL